MYYMQDSYSKFDIVSISLSLSSLSLSLHIYIYIYILGPGQEAGLGSRFGSRTGIHNTLGGARKH